MRAGKHVYCEKPLTHNVAEARQVDTVATEAKVATQMGNLGHSAPGMRQTVEWIQAGAIGPVREVHAWVGTSRWNPTLQGKPTDSMPVPDGIGLGSLARPARAAAVSQGVCPVSWRDFWAFGCGVLGDFGCHDLDAATWALDLHAPLSVEASPAGHTDAEIVPYGSIVRYQFGPRGGSRAGDRHLVRRRAQAGDSGRPSVGHGLPPRGVLFIGDKGCMLCGGAGGPPRLFPAALDTDFARPAPRSRARRAITATGSTPSRGALPAGSNFDYGARLTEIVLLGVLALRTGKAIDWDADAMTARGLDAADAILHEPAPQGWEPA